MNWDTEETSRWISNTEDLYKVCAGADARRIENIMIGYLSIGPLDGFSVNLDKVDWDAVAADMEVV